MSEKSILEQDAAAGGATMRELKISDGSIVRAAVAVRHFARARQKQYAYLQFKHQKKTITKYIGSVTSDDSDQRLLKGWQMLKELGVVEAQGWSWVVTPPKTIKKPNSAS